MIKGVTRPSENWKKRVFRDFKVLQEPKNICFYYKCKMCDVENWNLLVEILQEKGLKLNTGNSMKS